MPIDEGTDVVLLLTTLPVDETAADALAQALVERRLAACVSVLAPMRSTYRWQGTIEQSDERQVLIKTTARRVPDLKRAIGELHPYDTPELLVLAVADGAERYLRWVEESTR